MAALDIKYNLIHGFENCDTITDMNNSGIFTADFADITIATPVGDTTGNSLQLANGAQVFMGLRPSQPVQMAMTNHAGGFYVRPVSFPTSEQQIFAVLGPSTNGGEFTFSIWVSTDGSVLVKGSGVSEDTGLDLTLLEDSHIRFEFDIAGTYTITVAGGTYAGTGTFAPANASPNYSFTTAVLGGGSDGLFRYDSLYIYDAATSTDTIGVPVAAYTLQASTRDIPPAATIYSQWGRIPVLLPIPANLVDENDGATEMVYAFDNVNELETFYMDLVPVDTLWFGFWDESYFGALDAFPSGPVYASYLGTTSLPSSPRADISAMRAYNFCHTIVTASTHNLSFPETLTTEKLDLTSIKMESQA